MNNKNNPLVSICCLAYNHNNYIKDCIESIWNQEYKNIEIIVLDDGSNDGSDCTLKKLLNISPMPIDLIIQNNSGNIAKNLNKLLKRVTGEFVLLLSMDDFLKRDAISSKIKYFTEEKNIVFIANKINNFVNNKGKIIKKNHQSIPWKQEKHETAKDLLDIEYKYIHSYFVQGVLFKKSVIDKIGGFDEDLLGDDIILRTKLAIHLINNPQLKFKLLNRSAVNYRMHTSNIHKDLYRQVLLVKEWKDRFFPDRAPSDSFVSWIGIAFSRCLIDNKINNSIVLINILNDLLENENQNGKASKIKKFLNSSLIIKHRYLIPFIFEIMYFKGIREKEIQLIVFGIKIIRVLKLRSKLKLTFLFWNVVDNT